MLECRRGVVAVVDDDPAVLASLKLLLQVLGHEVATYPSALAFLDALTRSPDCLIPACLIIDQHMSRMTGLELVQKLRETGTKLPTLLITGALSQAIRCRAIELGVEAVLEKPPGEDDLLKFVNAHT
jgi:two-component system response regulator FixJ